MRTPTKYTVVKVIDGEIVADTYANADAAKDALAHVSADVMALLFVGEPIAFAVDTTPRVTLGSKKERKPRGPNKKKAKAIDAKPVNGHKTLSGNVIDEHL